MTITTLGLRGPVQIAYAVDDVVAAAESWVARGAGPFFISHNIPLSNSRMHGLDAAFDHSSAYGQYGDVMVELLCEHHPVADRIGPASGVHHMAFFVDDVAEAQATLASNGWAEALYAEAGTTAFAMHDARDELGHLIEIYQDSPGLIGFYDMVRSTAASWDGSDPVRVI
jgi:hypothetical protein